MTNATSELAVRTIDLTKRFARGNVVFDAVSHLNLSVARGEFVAVMGASGSGKSTALHMIAGLTRPTLGEIEIEGQPLSQMTDRALTIFRRRRLGFVFQSYNLIPHLTAEENLVFPLRADERTIDRETRDRLKKIWDELELGELLKQYPDELSGGQQQRVAIARALGMNPAVLLADEPTGNLDWTSSQDVCRILSRLHREEGCAIVLVTHEPAVAVWAERIVVLKDGRIAADAPSSSFGDAAELASRLQEIAREWKGGDA